MRAVFIVFPGLVVASLTLAAACSDSGSSSGVVTGGDAAASDSPSPPPIEAGADTSTITDSGTDAAEEPPTLATEVEPNDRKTATEIGKMVLPGIMSGKIDPANDVDVFAIDLAPGDFWDWTATPTPSSADLAPHVIVFDTAGGLNPTVAGFAGAGQPAKLQHFVLRTGKFVVGMRDARNVGADGGKGGPTFGYALQGKRGVIAPTTVTFPTTKTGKLASVGSVDLYTFTGSNGKGFDVFVRATKSGAPSTLDARLSLFDLTAKRAVGTNADLSSQSAQLGSASATNSAYMIIIENEGTNPTDLSYELELKLRP